MPEITTPNRLRDLNPIDDASAARMAEPQTHADLLESILAGDPTAGLDRAGSHWHETPTRSRQSNPDADRRRPHRSRRPLLIAGLAAALAAALVLIVPRLGSDNSSPGPSPASAAAVAKGAIKSLATKPNTIVTVRQQSTLVMPGKREQTVAWVRTEIVWIGPDGTVHARVSWTDLSHTVIQVVNRATLTAEFFDPTTDTIDKTRLDLGRQSGPLGVPANPNQFNPITIQSRLATQLRSLLHAGTLTVTGEKVVDGQQALVLECAPNCHDAGQAGIEYDVSRSTYDLIREVDGEGAQSATFTIQEFKTEPATPETERQFELTNTYPNAKVVWLSANGYVRALTNAVNGS